MRKYRYNQTRSNSPRSLSRFGTRIAVYFLRPKSRIFFRRGYHRRGGLWGEIQTSSWSVPPPWPHHISDIRISCYIQVPSDFIRVHQCAPSKIQTTNLVFRIDIRIYEAIIHHEPLYLRRAALDCFMQSDAHRPCAVRVSA